MKRTKRNTELSRKDNAYSPEEIVTIRRDILQVSQAIFAGLLGVSKQTVNSWESGWRIPSPMAMRFLDFVKNNPLLILEKINFIRRR